MGVTKAREDAASGAKRGTKLPAALINGHSNGTSGDSMDGRRLRSEKSRRKIIEATLELVREGQTTPSAEAVAARADVGLRSVFRHFSDMESLYAHLTDIVQDELSDALDPPLHHSALQDRLNELADRRCQAFEEAMPILTAISAQDLRGLEEQTTKSSLCDYLRKNLREALPSPVRRNGAFVTALDLALSYQSWRALRQDYRLSFKQAQKTVKMTVVALLTQCT